MTITNEKPHRRFGMGYGVSFWRDNTASNEETATRAVVYTGAPGMPYPEFTFDLPKQRGAMEQLETALNKAFMSGMDAAKSEIRKVLGLSK